MKPVLRYARKLTRDPAGICDADADAIFAAGWDDTALYHIVAVTALFNFMNRLVEGMGIKPDPRYVESAAERLATRGYKPLIDMLGPEQRAVTSQQHVVPPPGEAERATCMGGQGTEP
jgi:hypothetical protein